MPLYCIKYSVQTDNPERCNPLFIMNSFMLENQIYFIFLLSNVVLGKKTQTYP